MLQELGFQDYSNQREGSKNWQRMARSNLHVAFSLNSCRCLEGKDFPATECYDCKKTINLLKDTHYEHLNIYQT